MKACLHQPNYLPYIGFFHKILNTDMFIIYDTAQYVNDRFDNRNRIKVAGKEFWLTVPVKKESYFKPIKDAKVNNNIFWAKKQWKTIVTYYQKAPYFNEYKEIFEKIYSDSYENLVEISEKIIIAVLDILGFKGSVKKASDLGFDTELKSTEAIIDLLKKVNADCYLSGPTGKEYMTPELFEKAGIELEFQEFHHPTYKQLGEEFIPYLAIIDLIFNEGHNSRKIIMDSGPVAQK